ncbi:MAG: MiaB/RimO family radical SAM methylthiotransferase [Eggerthellaceae bacterium]|nr:MiaB/RimO family radical SAM methylthiotransferase [Eggerthellaceae bacterium]
MKYCVINLGCKVNRVESDEYEGMLSASGYVSADVREADVAVINTCTVTGNADKKTRKVIRRALRANEASTVIVTGCFAALHSDALNSYDARVVAVSRENAKDIIEDYIKKHPSCGENESLSAPELHCRRGVKIQDGCDNRCSYCIVSKARGPSVSMGHEQVIEECRRLLDASVPEIVLTGINLGKYDDNSMGLAQLLESLCELERSMQSPGEKLLSRFRLSSIEPDTLDDDTIELLSESDGLICRHLHLPLQSGSSKILKEMNRPYDAQYFLSLIEKLREKVPSISLSTDVIAGFPGESDDDFEDTLSVCEKCGFTKIHVFPYSKRAGTPAADRIDQVDEHVKSMRASRLMQLSLSLAKADYERRIGSVEFIAVEGKGSGRTESYHSVKLEGRALEGSLIECELMAGMRARPADERCGKLSDILHTAEGCQCIRE